MSSIRIVLTINPHLNPELFDELNRLPTRTRAERVRTLATIGITVCSGQMVMPRSPESDAADANHMSRAHRESRAIRVAKKLSRGI